MPHTAKTPSSSARPHPGQLLISANVVPDGLGGFRIVPTKPVQEIGARDVEKMLGLGRGSASYLINTPLGQKHLRWRRLSDRRRSKMLFDLASVLAYREATRHLD